MCRAVHGVCNGEIVQGWIRALWVQETRGKPRSESPPQGFIQETVFWKVGRGRKVSVFYKAFEVGGRAQGFFLREEVCKKKKAAGKATPPCGGLAGVQQPHCGANKHTHSRNSGIPVSNGSIEGRENRPKPAAVAL